MKKYLIITIIGLSWLLSSKAQTITTREVLNFDDITFEYTQDSLYIHFEMSNLYFTLQNNKSINLTPVLVSSVENKELPTISLKGKSNYKVFKRKLALMSKSKRAQYKINHPEQIIRYRNGLGETLINYKERIVYEPWMKNAQLIIKIDNCGCGKSNALTDILLANQPMSLTKEPYCITPYYAYITPTHEAIKRRSVYSNAVLDFPVGRSELILERSNNKKEIERIISELNLIANDKDIELTGIEISGYASPEGNIINNRELSVNRALVLKSYLIKKYPYAPDFYSTYFGGEDWQGLVTALSKSNLAYAEQVVALINNEEDVYKRKAKIERLNGGIPYQEMLATIYPSLRRVEFKSNFLVKQFEAKDTKTLLYSNPSHLSLREIYEVANDYVHDAKAYYQIWDIAANTYPDSEIAHINAATAALEMGNFAVAEKHLNECSKQSDLAEYYNTLGVLLMMRDNNLEQANRYFKVASEKGLSQGVSNSLEIEKPTIQ